MLSAELISPGPDAVSGLPGQFRRRRWPCRLALLVVVFLGSIGVAASDEPSVPPTEEDIEFFEKKIRPLLIERCFECHSERGKAIKGGLRLDSRTRMLDGGDSGPAVVPGKPAESLLIEAINYGQDTAQMPPRGKLPESEIALLTEWVRRGAPFPEATESPEKGGLAHRIDFEAGRTFWSFQPVREHSVPAVSRPEWGLRKIDPFVLSKLDAARLSPNPPADRRTILRRLAFDLTGLPPTLEELAAFETDTSVDAYERQVARLLDSPHYGERWGRFWLDLVRYCDILEQWAMDKSAKAWLYRDWVVQALNDDLPYDRFLTLQLAADLLPDARPTDIAALGLLGLSPSYWKELKLDQGVIKGVVAEEWEERIHTLSGAVLGLTVACARCHDHKQDPISQEDYYALAGVLASTKLTPRSILPANAATVVAQARAKIQAWQKTRDELQASKPPLPEGKLLDADLAQRIAELERSTPNYDVPLAYATEEASLHVLSDGPDRTRLEYKPGEPQNVAMQIRGSATRLGPIVPRRFLTVLSPEAPQPFQEGSGRRELARAFVTDAAPLVARVIVNRIWQQHFGQGLVDTPSNFGATGSAPSHPELLDDLAARFISHGWSFKWLHREIVLSQTYRQSSSYAADKFAIDPDNRLLWRANRRRLEVDAWRDAMLLASGQLDLALGGADRSLDDPGNTRRTLYATIKRRELHPMLRLLDFPDPTTHNAVRDVTTTPLQQLFILNSPYMQSQGAALARRVRQEAPGDTPRQIARAYQLLFGRLPTARQTQLAQEYLTPAGNDPGALDALWNQYAQALLAGSEFAFVD